MVKMGYSYSEVGVEYGMTKQRVFQIYRQSYPQRIS